VELLLIPLLSALLAFPFRKGPNAGRVALSGSILTLLVTFYYAYDFPVDYKYHYGINADWIDIAGIRFRLGMDGIGMLMLILTNLLVPLIIASGIKKEWDRPGLYYGMVLFMQFALNGVFMALDGMLFYIFWELTLIPIYFICAIWGGENRIRITMKFFLYTFAGSLLMLLAFILGYFNTQGMYSFSIEALYKIAFSPAQAYWVMLAFFVAFAVKIPVFPFHTWQPDTYTAAPPQGTMLLSGIMLKMGLFGLLRWMLPLAPEALPQLQHVLITLAIIGVVYASVIAIRQDDLKRLLAYSSMGHVGLIAAGIMTVGVAGIQGGLLQMFNHGINVVGLFFIADIIERRTGKRDLPSLGGIAVKAPRLAIAFMVIMLGSVAVPLTNGFVGEFMLLKGLFDLHWAYASVGGLTVIFTAVYMLRAYQFSMLGEAGPAAEGFKDLDTREMIILGVLCTLVVLLGVYPQPILDLTAPATQHLLDILSQTKAINP
jgi:NADH-quinone oxidoreductase subunit M